jgi:hypothetical protein
MAYKDYYVKDGIFIEKRWKANGKDLEPAMKKKFPEHNRQPEPMMEDLEAQARNILKRVRLPPPPPPKVM